MLIVTTLEECSVREYGLLADSIRRHRRGLDLHMVALTGEVSEQSRMRLESEADEVQSFFDFETYRKLEPMQDGLGHPIGKYAKLFLALEYLENAADRQDVVLFLDPDTFVQKPLSDLAQLARDDVLLFGHELELVHYANAPSSRLAVGERFDENGAWNATYFTEINTGVTLGTHDSFRRVVSAFATFADESAYQTKARPAIVSDFWHDQDFFRYFVRKTLPVDVGVLDLSTVFTTTKGASRCVRFDDDERRFLTSWGVVPHVLHFAGVTLGQIKGVPEDWVPDRDPTPAWSRGRPSVRAIVKRVLDISPLDVARVIRDRVSG